MGTNTETHCQRLCREWETLEHSALKEMLASNPSTQGPGNPVEEEAGNKEPEAMEDTKKAKPSKSTGLMHIQVHRDWGSMHYACFEFVQDRRGPRAGRKGQVCYILSFTEPLRFSFTCRNGLKDKDSWGNVQGSTHLFSLCACLNTHTHTQLQIKVRELQ